MQLKNGKEHQHVLRDLVEGGNDIAPLLQQHKKRDILKINDFA